MTHDLEEAFALSDKVAVMNAGVVEQFGAPAEDLREPALALRRRLRRAQEILEG